MPGLSGLSGALSGLSATYGGYKQGEVDEAKIADVKRSQLAKVAMGNALSMLAGGGQGNTSNVGPQAQPPMPGQQSMPMQQPGAQPPPGGVPMQPGGGMPGGQPQMRPPMPPGGGMPGAPPGGMPRPPMPQPGPGGQGGGPPQLGSGALDWRQLVAAVKQANPNITPDVMAEAVNQFLPLMNQQSAQEWKQVSLQIREQQLQEREQQFLLAEQGRNTRADEASGDRRYATDQRADTAGKQIVSRETIAKMTVDERREAHEAGIISKEQMDEANRNERGREADQRADTARAAESGRDTRAAAAEAGRNQRAELSATTKQEISKLSTQARKEIEAARLKVEGIKEEGRNQRAVMGEEGRDLRQRDAEGARDDRAQLSADTRKELAKMTAGARQELTEYLEGGRTQRFEENRTSREATAATAEEGRNQRAAATRDERRDLAGQAETGRNQRADQAESGRDTRASASLAERRGEFQQRESRLGEALQLRKDSTYANLEQKKQAALQKVQDSKGKQGLTEARAIIDAQDKHVRTLIQAYSATNTMKPAERKTMLDQADADYKDNIAALKQAASGQGASSAPSPPKPNDVIDGHRFKGGDPSKQENWEPVK